MRIAHCRRIAVVAGLLVVAGCAAAPAVTISSLSPPVSPAWRAPTTVPAPAADPAPAAPAAGPVPVTVPEPVTVREPAVTTVPPPTVPPIATHDATLGALPPARAAVPVAIDAGANISGPVVAAGVDAATGELAVPADASVVAWYEYGPAPGETGSAVLAAHVDWHGVPGIFFRLRDLQVGDPVTVTMSDGATQQFHVVDIRMVDKPELPRTGVFARTGPPTLALVTCGGEFDSSTHHYLSNVVVTAAPD